MSITTIVLSDEMIGLLQKCVLLTQDLNVLLADRDKLGLQAASLERSIEAQKFQVDKADQLLLVAIRQSVKASS